MKALVVIGRSRGAEGTPYVMAQVEDHAYEEGHVKEHMEGRLQDALGREFKGIPRRLVWIEAENGFPVPMDMLTALIDGAMIPWNIVEERFLGDA